MADTNLLPMTPGLCGCGCGQSTSIATQSDTRRGWIKGQATRYRPGHGRWSGRTPEQRAAAIAAQDEQNRARMRQRYAAHRERLRMRQKQQRAENPELFRAYEKKYRTANPDRVRASLRRWQKANPDRMHSHRMQRRALKMAIPSERITRSVVWARDGGMCGICRQPADPTNWDLDHIISLDNKGPHVYWNVWVTHPFCNRSKGAKFLPYALAA
jgi:5-methylcytosine-specific restriction endonuclease McrA